MVRLRADSLGNMVLTSDTSSSNSEASDPSEDDYSSTASLQPESEDLEIDLPTMDEDPDPAEEADASSIDYEGQYPTESIKQSLQKCFSAAEAMKETLAVAVANPGDETVISNSAKKKLRKHMNVVQEQVNSPRK